MTRWVAPDSSKKRSIASVSCVGNSPRPSNWRAKYSAIWRAASGLDLQHAVAGIAQLEDVARHALDGEILVDRADHRRLRLEHDRVVAGVRDRAARHHRRHAAAFAPAQAFVNGVAMQVAGSLPAARAEAFGQHAHDRIEIL